jgi:sugar phosphate isomerase/epimerase
MPQFGICLSVEESANAKAAGWDFVEESVQGLLKGLVSDAEWDGSARVKNSALPVRAANMLVPAALKITGSEVNPAKLGAYISNVMRRAQQLGLSVLVFGSAGARNVPEGFDRGKARGQIIDFLKMTAPLAGEHRVTLVVEPLNRGESNIINGVEEAMQYVRAVNHPSLKALVDSFHHWLDGEPLEDVEKNIAHIAHVHVADKDGRVAPGESGTSDYRKFFGVLKRAGYDGMISVEALGKMTPEVMTRARAHLQKAWEQA